MKEDDLLVLRVLEIQGSFNRSKDGFPSAVNILVCDVSHLLLLWYILVWAVRYLLLLWISWFVVSYLLLLWPICTEKVFIILKEDDLMMWVICFCCDISWFELCVTCYWFVLSYLLLLWPICTEKVFIILKEDDLLVLRVLEIQGSFNRSKDGFPLAVNILVCDVSHLLLLWYILVWAVRYLLLLWISWFVVSYLLLLWPICTEKVFIILKEDDLLVLRILEIQGSFNRSKDGFPLAVNILVCDVSYLLLLWISRFALWIFNSFAFAVNILVCAVRYLLLLSISWFVLSYLLLLWQLWARV